MYIHFDLNGFQTARYKKFINRRTQPDKKCIYKNRMETLNVHIIINKIKGTYQIEKNMYSCDIEKFDKKWPAISPLLNGV